MGSIPLPWCSPTNFRVMDAISDKQAGAHTADSADHHHELSFLRKWVFSTDHKFIGIQYGIVGLFFLLVGLLLMMVMRWSLAFPMTPLPPSLSWILHLFGEDFASRWAGDATVRGPLYNMFGAMHGTFMVFFGVVPL